MDRLVLIGLAGATGALTRYGLQSAVTNALGRPTVLGTLLINVAAVLTVVSMLYYVRKAMPHAAAP